MNTAFPNSQPTGTASATVRYLQIPLFPLPPDPSYEIKALVKPTQAKKRVYGGKMRLGGR
jgi:hypothetical protein